MENKESMSRSLKVKRTVAYIVLILITFLCLFPFVILIINTSRSHSQIQKGFSLVPGKSLVPNINNLMENDNLPVIRAGFNSIYIALFTAAVTSYFSALTAYAFYAYEFKLKKAAMAFILFVMMIPTQVSTLGFLNQMDLFGLTDTFVPLILPAVASPVVVFFMYQYLTGYIPKSIIEAARIDGSSEFATFNKIILPIMKPALAVQAIFAFIGSWNNYFTPNLLLDSKHKKTLPILIAQLRSADFMKFDMGQVYTLIAFSIIPAVIIYLLLSKYIIGGMTLGSVKG